MRDVFDTELTYSVSLRVDHFENVTDNIFKYTIGQDEADIPFRLEIQYSKKMGFSSLTLWNNTFEEILQARPFLEY